MVCLAQWGTARSYCFLLSSSWLAAEVSVWVLFLQEGREVGVLSWVTGKSL